jgi:hypothetical protein
MPRIQARTHALERLDDAPHRPAGERGVADNRARKLMARQHPGQQPHRGAGIAGVERAFR